MELEPVPDIPALVMRGTQSWICIADLHIGIEVQLRRSGFSIPSQAPVMLKSLEALASRADRLMILGDVKHRIPAVGYKENREIPPFMCRLQEMYKGIRVVAGNHDGGLSTVLPEGVESIGGPGQRLDDVGVCHGHVWPSKEAMSGTRLVMGHIHPSVQLTDSIGARSNEKCWVRANFRKKKVLERFESCPQELVIVPAFNPLLTGTPINAGKGTRLGPIFRNQLVDERKLNIYLLDGSNLGAVGKV